MAKMISILTMVERVRSLTPNDLNNWEKSFQASIERSALAERTSELSDAQLEALQRLYEKHFTG